MTMVSNIDQPIQSYTPAPALTGVSYSGPLSTCLNHPGARYQTKRDIPYTPQSLLELFKLATPNLGSLPCLFPPKETTIKALVHVFPSPTQYLRGPPPKWAPPWHSMNYSKLSLQEQSAPSFLPYYTPSNLLLYYIPHT